MSIKLKGIGASQGIAIGPGWVYRPIEVKFQRTTDKNPVEEEFRFKSALVKSGRQLKSLYKKTLDTVGSDEAAIFEAHQLILEDPEFMSSTRKLIREDHVSAEAAVNEVVESYAAQMETLHDEYFRARAQDIRDVGRRILYCLVGVDADSIEFPSQPVIISADDLTPSDTVQFDREQILGLCTRKGGPTSHTAILARSLGVPAIVNVPFELKDIETCKKLVLNGTQGELVIDPSEDELTAAESQMKAWQYEWQIQLESAGLPARSRDGTTVEIVANIGNLEDARQALEYGAEGVGLLRTEFLYLDRKSMPDESDQVGAYKEIFEVMGERPVVVRTLDIGGDKEVDYLGLSEEPNPFLGWRAIRMVSERADVLELQLRALLRAGVDSDLRIMIPLVSNIQEVKQARDILFKSKQNLAKEGLDYKNDVQFGIMVEVPSAALLIEHISGYVDFFSIGTNDLTQYTLAVDRTNERVSGLATPFHPAVLKLIAMTIRGAHKHGKWVGLCGEMAGDPIAAPVLLGLELDEFSMAPTSIPVVKQVIRQLERDACIECANQVLNMSSADEVKNYLRKFLGEIVSK